MWSGSGDGSTGSSYTDGKTALSTYEAPKKLYWRERETIHKNVDQRSSNLNGHQRHKAIGNQA